MRLPVSLDKVNERLIEHHGALTHVIDGKRVKFQPPSQLRLKVLALRDLACMCLCQVSSQGEGPLIRCSSSETFPESKEGSLFSDIRSWLL
jgi:hypothetical protein